MNQHSKDQPTQEIRSTETTEQRTQAERPQVEATNIAVRTSLRAGYNHYHPLDVDALANVDL